MQKYFLRSITRDEIIIPFERGKRMCSKIIMDIIIIKKFFISCLIQILNNKMKRKIRNNLTYK